ncbi:MAG TPA: hypothetical protein VF505_10175 [Thermoanaerobaculia bacterium]
MRYALAGLLLATQLSASPLEPRLTQEIDRLDALLKSVSSSAAPQAMIEGNRTLLTRARAATSPLLRIYRLRDASVGIETLRYAIAHKSDESDLARVQALANAERAAIDKPLSAMNAPALQLALRQIVANRDAKLLRASVPYGKASSPANGLFYVGEAEANRKFREFLETLSFGGSVEERPNDRAIDAALTKLDTSALAAFEEDPAGRSAVGLSARLKEARELAEQGSLEGAALTLLEAQLDISRRSAPPANAAVSLRTSRGDSIAAMFEAAAREDGGDTARIITNSVLPLYRSLFANVPIQKKLPKNVTVTLVRWPYT